MCHVGDGHELRPFPPGGIQAHPRQESTHPTASPAQRFDLCKREAEQHEAPATPAPWKSLASVDLAVNFYRRPGLRILLAAGLLLVTGRRRLRVVCHARKVDDDRMDETDRGPNGFTAVTADVRFRMRGLSGTPLLTAGAT